MLGSVRVEVKEYRDRSARLMRGLPENGVIVIRSARKKVRSNDTHYPYRQDSHFFYLTGLELEDAICIINHEETVILHKQKDAWYERWEGRLPSAETIQNNIGCDKTLPIESFTSWAEKLHPRSKVYGRHSDQAWYQTWWKGNYEDIDKKIIQLRSVKSDTEIQFMQRACDISVASHQEVIKNQKKYASESLLSAFFTWTCQRQGANGLAYNSIVAQGDNACILHYHALSSQINQDACILMDAGAEYQNYASDITRVWPRSGRFSSEHKAVYTACLEIQKACIDAVKPGVTLGELNALSELETCRWLKKLGLVDKSPEEIQEKGLHKPFFCHSIGHSIGLDVHDGLGKDVPLKPNMVITIEPGLYLSENNETIPEAYRGLGVRIEDMVCVTNDGRAVMSAKLEKNIEAIEALSKG